MSTLTAIVPPRLARPRDYLTPVRRFFDLLARWLPSITTKRTAYRRHAEIFRMLGNAQKDLAFARAYYDASDVLRSLAEEPSVP